MSASIVLASTRHDFDAFASLYSKYEEWLSTRYADVPGLIAGIGAHQDMTAERQQLAVKYGPPNGRTLLALDKDNKAVGCVCYRRIGDTTCEMKRLYVEPSQHGRGLGRRLCESLVEQAVSDGYSTMKLDTGVLQPEATALYTSMGFEFCDPYIEYPPGIKEYVRFMTRDLSGLVDSR